MSDLLMRLEQYDSIGFDLDDTLYFQSDYDREIYLHYFTEVYGPSLGTDLSNKLIEKKQQVPKGYPRLFDDFASEENIDLDVESFVGYYRNPPKIYLNDKVILDPIINQLIIGGKLLFICTNGHLKTQLNKIESLGLNRIIENIYILSPEGKYPMKPSPAIKGVLPITGRTVYLGDQDIDKQFAINCGFDFIRINISEYV